MFISKSVIRQICRQLGLNEGQDSEEFNSVTVLNCGKCGCNIYRVSGFYSVQCDESLKYNKSVLI